MHHSRFCGVAKIFLRGIVCHAGVEHIGGHKYNVTLGVDAFFEYFSERFEIFLKLSVYVVQPEGHDDKIRLVAKHLRFEPRQGSFGCSSADGCVYHIYGDIIPQGIQLSFEQIPIYVFVVDISVHRAVGNAIPEYHDIDRTILLKSFTVQIKLFYYLHINAISFM